MLDRFPVSHQPESIAAATTCTGMEPPPPPLTLSVHVPQVSPPKRPLSARDYLRQPPDATDADTWEAAAQNIGRHSNRMPIDPLRTARAHPGSEAHSSGKRRPHTARTFAGSTGRNVKGGLDFNFARTPSMAKSLVQGATNEGGRKARSKKLPKYAEYQIMGCIPSLSRTSMSKVGYVGRQAQTGRHTLTNTFSSVASSPIGMRSPARPAKVPGSLMHQNVPGSPMAVGGLESPIFIQKNHVAEWTSDSTLHPLVLSKRTRGWSATPLEAAPKGSHDLTDAKLATTKARLRHMIANELPPTISSFFLDGLDSPRSSEHDSESAPLTPRQNSNASKGPDPASAGNGLVQNDDDRCKPGTKVKIAFSFCMEDWAAHLVGKGKTLTVLRSQAFLPCTMNY